MKYSNDFSFLLGDNCSCRDNGDVNNLVVVDALNVGMSARLVDYPDIFSSDSAIRSSVNQRSGTLSFVIRSDLGELVNVDATIFLSVDGDFVIFCFLDVLPRHRVG